MNKKLLTLLATGALVANIAAADEQYGKIEGGMTFNKFSGKIKDDTYNTVAYTFKKVKRDGTSPVVGIAYGMSFDENVALELGLQYSMNAKGKYKYTQAAVEKEGNFKVRNLAVMLNGYYHIPTNGDFKPYLTAGVGYGKTRAKNVDLKTKSKGHFVYNLGAGVDVAVNDTTTLDIGYRFVDLGKIASKATLANNTNVRIPNNLKLKSHRVMVGAKFKF